MPSGRPKKALASVRSRDFSTAKSPDLRRKCPETRTLQNESLSESESATADPENPKLSDTYSLVECRGVSATTDTSAPTRRVLIVADPGRATQDAQAVASDIERHLQSARGLAAEVTVQSELLRISADDTTGNRQARVFRDGYADGNAAGSADADAVILHTEMPRHDDQALIAVEEFPDEHVAIVSNPVFGAAGSRNRLRESLTEVSSALLAPDNGRGDGSNANHRDVHQRSAYRRSGPGALVRTMVGMVKQNEPWSTLPKMSGALAAAMGTGAFGVFYSSIWQMASFLSPLRMAVITVVSICIMVAWLIVSNKLWDRPRNDSAKAVIALYNGSTLLTLGMLVVGLYAVLFVAILLGGVAVIDPEFLAQQLGQPAEFTHYLRIAWLSTSMGVVAGALGAGFDSDADLRRITNGARDRQREYAASAD